MVQESRRLTAANSLNDWLQHPQGGALLRELLAQAGFDEQVLAPVRMFSLQRLIAMSQGGLPQSVVDDLVERANAGLESAADDVESEEPAEWQERIVPARFVERTVIVTGAASGIGRATASRVAREGGRVIAVDIAAERLDAFAAELPDADMVIVQTDITRNADIERVVAAAGSRIDALANVAGIADDFSPVHEVTDEMWDRVFAVNVLGLFRLMRAVLPVMLAAGRGSIVNVASEAALRGNAAGVAYTASKHAVVGITRSAAFMYGPHGIRVNAVAPGGVATGMRSQGHPSDFGNARLGVFLPLIPPLAIAEQVAASITFLLSDDATNINGAILPSDGGWSVQ